MTRGGVRVAEGGEEGVAGGKVTLSRGFAPGYTGICRAKGVQREKRERWVERTYAYSSAEGAEEWVCGAQPGRIVHESRVALQHVRHGTRPREHTSLTASILGTYLGSHPTPPGDASLPHQPLATWHGYQTLYSTLLSPNAGTCPAVHPPGAVCVPYVRAFAARDVSMVGLSRTNPWPGSGAWVMVRYPTG